MNNLINERNLNEAHEQGKEGNGNFNCWNATLFVLGKTDELYWSDNYEIADFINGQTVKVDVPELGDILVLYNFPPLWFAEEEEVDPDELRIAHTAVYTGTDKWFHKRGENCSEFVTEVQVKEIYDDFEKSEYRRVVKV